MDHALLKPGPAALAKALAAAARRPIRKAPAARPASPTALSRTAQSLAAKRAEVEFHRFASLGEPERVVREYAEKNRRRAAMIRKHLGFCGRLTPFLEIGANAGHTSYMLANEFGADGFALDISADALAYGAVLKNEYGYSCSPVRIAGDGARLPFRDNSLAFVMVWQTLSQFMDIERVFTEAERVLAPGGVFVFGEEPMRRLLSLRLYECPYPEAMRPWERRLYDWGLLGYLSHDVIGTRQETLLGLRQNHGLGLGDWHALVTRHFDAHEYEMFVPERGWGERGVKRAAVRLDPHRSVWRAAKLLGGTLTGFCRKAGASDVSFSPGRFEACLACPDCGGAFERDAQGTLACVCGYRSALEDGVYNLLPSPERAELYPGERDDILDISRPGHEGRLGEGWYSVEGVFGNRYRWIGARAAARLKSIRSGPQRLRIRGFAPEQAFMAGRPRIRALVNGMEAGVLEPRRPGAFVLEADVPAAGEYEIAIEAQPVWKSSGDVRELTVNLSMIRLLERSE